MTPLNVVGRDPRFGPISPALAKIWAGPGFFDESEQRSLGSSLAREKRSVHLRNDWRASCNAWKMLAGLNAGVPDFVRCRLGLGLAFGEIFASLVVSITNF